MERGIAYSEVRFHLYHDIANDRYAWFLEHQIKDSEFWKASEWFSDLEQAKAWKSIEYLDRKRKNIEAFWERYGA